MKLLLFSILLFTFQFPVDAFAFQSSDDERTAIPSVDLQIKFRDEIRASDEFKNASENQAENLIKAGRSVEDNPAKKYAFYREGLKAALEACDPDSAIFALDQLDREFQIDFWKFILDSTETLRKNAKADKQRLAVRKMVDEFANQAKSSENFDVAETLAGRSIVISNLLKDSEGKAIRTNFKKQIGSLRAFQENSIKAQETLAKTPDDSNALLAMGHYQIFVKGDFESGLGNWSKSKSTKYRKLAEMEFELDKDNPALAFDVAGKWHDLGSKTSGIREMRFKERARYWYELCQAKLTGDAKMVARDRLDEIGKFLNATNTAAASALATNGPTPEAPPKFEPKTQLAIDSALDWIARHQLPDGSWSYEHSAGGGDFRKTSGDGSADNARAAATAMAIITFQNSGSTHKAGKYKRQVQGGLNFLMNTAKKSGRGISYLSPAGTMYSHALVTRAFCEAYGLTNDRRLAAAAQSAIWYLEDAQDPVGGGWRYQPKQPGDTSVLGWQLTALNAARKNKITVQPNTYAGARKFLDHVDSPDGIYFGYSSPVTKLSKINARSVIGMYGRIETGLDKSDPKVQTSAQLILDRKVDPNFKDAYYHYYATKLLKLHGGKAWETWQRDVRDMLLKTQHQQAFEKGSWWNNDKTHAATKHGRYGTTIFALWCLME